MKSVVCFSLIMEILENKNIWLETFRNTWLAELEQIGVPNWKIYQHPRNEQAPGLPGINLRQSKLLVITTAGAYLQGEQEPFDEPNQYGDYTLRTFPTSTPFPDLAYAHGHYDSAMILADAQVGLPLRHLRSMISEGKLGGLAPEVISFMGYQPDLTRVVDELIPAILPVAKDLKVQAALLVPA